MKPIVLFGMQGGGTTTIARALHGLGASLGSPESVGRSCDNGSIRRVNAELLDALGGGWECPPVMPKGWTRGRATQVVTLARARATLLSEFGDAPVGVLKDSRTCLTLPFWLPAFDEPPVVILVHRHPSEVADALVAQHGLGRAHAFAVWERANHDALMHAAGLSTFAVDHRTLVEDPAGVIARIVAALAEWGVQLPNDLATTDLDLAPPTRRHRVADPTRFDDPVATPEQRELFRILQGVDDASACFALPERLPAPNPVSLELLALAAQVRRGASRRGGEWPGIRVEHELPSPPGPHAPRAHAPGAGAAPHRGPDPEPGGHRPTRTTRGPADAPAVRSVLRARPPATAIP